MSFGKIFFLWFIGFFLLFQNTCFAQKDIEPLLQLWKEQKLLPGYATDTNSVLILTNIAQKYLYDQPDTALYFGNEALTLAQQQQYKKGEMESQYLLGRIYYVKGSYNRSLESNVKAMELSKLLNDEGGYALGLNTTGLVYIGQHNYEAALEEFFKAVKINAGRKDSLKLTKNYFNIGLCYDETGKYDSAVSYLEEVIRIGKEISDHRMVVMSYNRLGETYFHTKNYPKALKYYRMVLQDSLYESNWENSFAYAGLGQTYYALGKYQTAVRNAFEGFEFARKMNAKWDAERALHILSDAYAALRDFEQAYHYHQQYKAYSDSLYSEAKDREMNFLHLQQKESENQQLARDNQIQQQKNHLSQLIILIISLAALFTLIVAMLIFRSNRQKNHLNKLLLDRNQNIALQKEKISEQNEALTALNTTKDQIFSVISHDLKSPFASIMGTFDLISGGLLNMEEQTIVFQELHRKVATVSEMLNNLLYWANAQQKGINAVILQVNLSALAEEILSVYYFLAEEKNIVIDHTYDSSKFIYADPDHAKIILQNILGNAIKFTPEQGHIHIFYSEEETYLAVHVKDSGVGIPPEKLEKLFIETGKNISSPGTNHEKGTGIGLMLVQQFIHGNQGELKINSKPGEGSEFIMYFRKYNNQVAADEEEASRQIIPPEDNLKHNK